ncbi:hypothetical protein ACJMK2_002646 [Sinanodonta woodiana]|uniref:Uncharacterized protein n=1 Tax=Sinanodonta woodiana TaxID=1069815 RepID=A0ABD3XZ35_SINWO
MSSDSDKTSTDLSIQSDNDDNFMDATSSSPPIQSSTDGAMNTLAVTVNQMKLVKSDDGDEEDSGIGAAIINKDDLNLKPLNASNVDFTNSDDVNSMPSTPGNGAMTPRNAVVVTEHGKNTVHLGVGDSIDPVVLQRSLERVIGVDNIGSAFMYKYTGMYPSMVHKLCYADLGVSLVDLRTGEQPSTNKIAGICTYHGCNRVHLGISDESRELARTRVALELNKKDFPTIGELVKDPIFDTCPGGNRCDKKKNIECKKFHVDTDMIFTMTMACIKYEIRQINRDATRRIQNGKRVPKEYNVTWIKAKNTTSTRNYRNELNTDESNNEIAELTFVFGEGATGNIQLISLALDMRIAYDIYKEESLKNSQKSSAPSRVIQLCGRIQTCISLCERIGTGLHELMRNSSKVFASTDVNSLVVYVKTEDKNTVSRAGLSATDEYVTMRDEQRKNRKEAARQQYLQAVGGPIQQKPFQRQQQNNSMRPGFTPQYSQPRPTQPFQQRQPPNMQQMQRFQQPQQPNIQRPAPRYVAPQHQQPPTQQKVAQKPIIPPLTADSREFIPSTARTDLPQQVPQVKLRNNTQPPITQMNTNQRIDVSRDTIIKELELTDEDFIG